MELYVVYNVATGYEPGESVIAIFFNESNARKELERAKDTLIAVRADSRFKKWWTEEPLDPYTPDTIVQYRLHDEVITYNEDHNTDQLLEIRVLQTGDEPNAIGRSEIKKSKSTASKKSQEAEED